MKYTVLKIVGGILLGVGVVGIILSFTNFGNFSNNLFMVGGVMTTFGIFAGSLCLMMGSFLPKAQEKLKELNEEISKEEEKKKESKSFVYGSEEKKKETCRYCGSTLDGDEDRCPNCGAKQ